MPRGTKNTKRFEKAVKSIVQDELKEELEMKVAIAEQADIALNAQIPYGDVTASSNFQQLLPAIEQSTTSEAGMKYNMRIGNEIRLYNQKLKFQMEYIPNTTSDTIGNSDRKIRVRVMIVRPKRVSDAFKAVEDFPEYLLRGGSQDVKNFQGVALDGIREINRDAFSVRFDKSYYLSAPITQAYSGAQNVLYSLNPSTLVMDSVDLRFGENGKKLTFSNTEDLSPEQYPYLLLVGYSSMSGSDVPNNSLVRFTYNCSSFYTDA